MSNDGRQVSWITTGPLGPSAIGAGLFLAFAPIHLWVPEQVSVAIAALTLALIGGAYIGFGASARSAGMFWMELGVAAFYALVALAGLLWTPLALPSSSCSCRIRLRYAVLRLAACRAVGRCGALSRRRWCSSTRPRW